MFRFVIRIHKFVRTITLCAIDGKVNRIKCTGSSYKLEPAVRVETLSQESPSFDKFTKEKTGKALFMP